MKNLMCVVGLICGLMSNAAIGQSNWAQWRGPSQDGHSTEQGLPTTWDAKSVTWGTPLKGDGQSSPVLWGNRIFLTESLEEGAKRAVFCVDRNDGQVQWHRVVWTGEPEPVHNMNRWASATCTTDGKHVYAFFGRGGGLFCLTLDGEIVWEKNLGRFESPWGTASCPKLVGDLIVQNCDADEGAYITALNKNTGDEVWKADRPQFRGWSTPVAIEANGSTQLVTNGHTGTYAYDAKTGKQVWFVKAGRGRGTPTVAPHNGMVFVVSGLGGAEGAYAVKPGGSGDVSATAKVWAAKRGSRDLPSPIIVNDQMLVMSLRSPVLTAYDIKSGDELWKERVGGQVSASPVAFGGLTYFIDEAGETIVVDTKATPKIVRRNKLAPSDTEIFRSCITPSEGQVFIRSTSMLYCIGTRTTR